MTNKKKLQKILVGISRTDTKGVFKSVEIVQKRIQEIKGQIESIFNSIIELKGELKKSEGELSGALNQKLLTLKSAMAEYKNASLERLGVLSAEIDGLKKDIREISGRKVEIPDFQNQIKDVENELKRAIFDLNEDNEKKLEEVLSNSQKAIADLREELKKLRIDTMSVISSRGGGNMNRNILVENNPSILGRYTDLNILAGSNVTFASTNNDNLKTTDLTIAIASSPTFANITDSGLTAGRVTFAGAAGLLTDSALLKFDSITGQLGVGFLGTIPDWAVLYAYKASGPANSAIQSGDDYANFRILSFNADSWFMMQDAGTANSSWYVGSDYSDSQKFKIGWREAAAGQPGDNDFLTISTTGNVGIGTTTPTAVLHLKAGTATANTAPFKFTSGPLLTTPEAGAKEFLTDKFYGTITTGAVRHTFATLESAAQTFSNDILVPDEAYGVDWNGSLEVPTKNAIYDKIETISGIPAGLDTQVQFNDGGVFGGDAGFVYNKATGRVGIGTTPIELLDIQGTMAYDNASTATVLSGNTSVAVTFPTAFQAAPIVVATPMANVSCWITSITASGCTINIGSAAGTAGVIVNYIAIRET